MADYQITGRVVDRSTGKGIPGLQVEAWDDDLIFDDLVGSDVTDADGGFQMRFSDRAFRELFFDRTPDLYFRVLQEGERLLDTRGRNVWSPRKPDEPVVLHPEHVPPSTKPVEQPTGGGDTPDTKPAEQPTGGGETPGTKPDATQPETPATPGGGTRPRPRVPSRRPPPCALVPACCLIWIMPGCWVAPPPPFAVAKMWHPTDFSVAWGVGQVV